MQLRVICHVEITLEEEWSNCSLISDVFKGKNEWFCLLTRQINPGGKWSDRHHRQAILSFYRRSSHWQEDKFPLQVHVKKTKTRDNFKTFNSISLFSFAEILARTSYKEHNLIGIIWWHDLLSWVKLPKLASVKTKGIYDDQTQESTSE